MWTNLKTHTVKLSNKSMIWMIGGMSLLEKGGWGKDQNSPLKIVVSI